MSVQLEIREFISAVSYTTSSTAEQYNWALIFHRREMETFFRNFKFFWFCLFEIFSWLIEQLCDQKVATVELLMSDGFLHHVYHHKIANKILIKFTKVQKPIKVSPPLTTPWSLTLFEHCCYIFCHVNLLKTIKDAVDYFDLARDGVMKWFRCEVK
jgi:hypothetical protein